MNIQSSGKGDTHSPSARKILARLLLHFRGKTCRDIVEGENSSCSDTVCVCLCVCSLHVFVFVRVCVCVCVCVRSLYSDRAIVYTLSVVRRGVLV